MARFTITDRFVRNAKPTGGRSEFFDDTARGLALRVSEKGVKSWCFHFTANGVRKRLTLGTYPTIGLAKARTLTLETRGLIAEGKPPKAIQPNTLQAVCEDYLRREGPKLRTVDERTAVFERLVYPAFGDWQIEAIKRSNVVSLLDEIEEGSGAVMADKVLAFLSKLFNWHASRSDEFRSPIVRGMARTKPKERARERTLTDDELRAIWRGEGIFGAFVRFTLLTATRRNEAAQAQHSEISGRDWIIPGERYKTKADHLIPLSSAALATLPKHNGEWVFSTDGKNPISGFSKFKRHLDKASGVGDWTLHDLRRTARSLMSRAGVSTDHAERCLGHTMPGVRGTYDRHAYADEKRRAFEALALQVQRIIEPKENVVSLGRERGRS
jgi:integrase